MRAIIGDGGDGPSAPPTLASLGNRLGRIAHDVCYVTEAKAYLDYNNRKYISNLQRSGRTIRQIATEVADSFEANWTSASEYTYDYKEEKKHFNRTVVKTDPPAQDPDVRPPAASAPR